MDIGLRNLIDEELLDHSEESRRYHDAAARRRPDLSHFDGVRRARAERAASPDTASPRVAEHRVQTGGRAVSLRIVPPVPEPSRGVVLDIPGGGFLLSLAARGDTRNAQLADSLAVTVVSVDYRLAPEEP
jgi:acetyl esterase